MLEHRDPPHRGRAGRPGFQRAYLGRSARLTLPRRTWKARSHQVSRPKVRALRLGERLTTPEAALIARSRWPPIEARRADTSQECGRTQAPTAGKNPTICKDVHGADLAVVSWKGNSGTCPGRSSRSAPMAEDVDHAEVLPVAGELVDVACRAVRERHLVDRVDDVDSLAGRAAAAAADQAAPPRRAPRSRAHRCAGSWRSDTAPLAPRCRRKDSARW